MRLVHFPVLWLISQYSNRSGDMEKPPLVYRRRPRKPLAALPTNVVEDDDASGSRASPSGTGEECGNCRTGKAKAAPKKSRKSWIDRSLSNKGRRSSWTWGEEFNLAVMAYKWAGTLFASKDSGLPAKKPSAANRSRRVRPPAEFVKEKQAMFAEIDSFELESEEESPMFKSRSQDWPAARVDVPKERFLLGRALQIVPEDELEEVAVDSLSAALLTPVPNPKMGTAQMESAASDLSPSSSRDSCITVLEPNLAGICAVLAASPEDRIGSFSGSLNRSLSGEFLSEEEEVSSLVSELTSLRIGFEDEPNNGDGRDLKPSPERPILLPSEGISGEVFLGTRAENLQPVFDALLEECQQTRPLSLRHAIAEFCDLADLVKIGEGTFGEAFKGGGCVFKIVPMDGDFLVNGEVQKTSAEIYSEVLLTNTLDRLRGSDSTACANYCTNFIETKAVRICQGSYEEELSRAWEEWDASRPSDNDHPMRFPQHQLYVVFVLADGGKDLETFVLSDFNEVRSVLLQVILALGIAEEGCGFEHRDLHWGNVVLARGEEYTHGHYRLRDSDFLIQTFGISVSIIDFTLSRIDTGSHVFFCNLSADPALFEGPSCDTQSDTYKRMLEVTQGNWEGSFSQTNCYWIHYLADVLLKKKSYRCSSGEKRALRMFCKRALLYASARETIKDDFFRDMWIENSLIIEKRRLAAGSPSVNCRDVDVSFVKPPCLDQGEQLPYS